MTVHVLLLNCEHNKNIFQNTCIKTMPYIFQWLKVSMHYPIKDTHFLAFILHLKARKITRFINRIKLTLF